MKWHNNGFILLSNLISEKRHDIKTLANFPAFKLFEYLEVQMGAIYFTQKENKIIYLKLLRGYTLDPKRLNEEKIHIGEGLIGSCFKKRGL